MVTTPPPDIVDSLVADWQRARPQTKADPIQVIGRIIWLGRQYEEAVTRMPSNPGLSYSDYDVIATLRRAGSPYELTPTELGRRVLLTSGGLTACLRRLEAAGLISRRGVPEDRRMLLARLTPKGFDLIESFVDERFAMAELALASLDPQQRATLEVLLRRLVSPIDGAP
ncbi:MarR family winged helix-turn-helix transcriptional regulator [Brevundimonas sp. UBA7664]|uniref:MarR family winged helix-turn-helix transcriptional regulator n=1 Tax=Brevundimonas sp. UBA7664 TaxID=1946141 RepID=UPI0025C2E53D|nr:MarR family transcriptional regulator [Brevundimonas sp. UBA7664]